MTATPTKQYYSQLALFYLVTAPIYPIAAAYTLYLAGLAHTPAAQVAIAATAATDVLLPLLTRRDMHAYTALAGLPVTLAAATLTLAAPSTPAAAATLIAAATQAYTAYHTLRRDLGKTRLARATALVLASPIPAILAHNPTPSLAAATYLLALPPALYAGEEAAPVYLNFAASTYTLTTALLATHAPPNPLHYVLDACIGELGYFYFANPTRIYQLLARGRKTPKAGT